jgi:hypothetical protein
MPLPVPSPSWVIDEINRMTGAITPGGRSDHNKNVALDLAAHIANSGPFVPGIDASGFHLDTINRQLARSGIKSNWLGLVKPQLIIINKIFPGHIQGVADGMHQTNCPEQLVDIYADRRRAFMYLFGPSLLDPLVSEYDAGRFNPAWW